MTRGIRYRAEYALVRAGLFLTDGLSPRAASRLGAIIADAWFVFDLPRRRTAIRNIIDSGVCAGRREAVRIARASFRHFASVATDSLKSAAMLNQSNWREHVSLNMSPALLNILSDPARGVLVATGHVGSWEIAGRVLSYLKPVVGIARPMNNPLVENLMLERRPQERFSLTPKHHADTQRFLAVLREGQALALMIDQHARDRGVTINFFNRPASTYPSIALLHLVTRAPLVFGYCLRTGPASFELSADGPLRHEPTGNKDADIRRILQELTGRLEEVVRQHPEQYLWAHRRWRQTQQNDKR